MSSVNIWAPYGKELLLCLGNKSVPMLKDDNHWWRSDVTLSHGQDYSIMINGRGPFPDPRSPWQPHGIHRNSRFYDHNTYPWRIEQWHTPSLNQAIIYELHIGTFTPEGTFSSTLEKLDYLQTLGITHICVMPIATFSGSRGWGYDGVQLYAPHPHYGTPDQFKALVDECHARNINVIIDVVYNHLGPTGNYLSQFGPYFTGTYQTPWGEAVNLDEAHSHEVRQFFIDNALMWLRDYHCDGVRLDAVHAMLDRSAEHFLATLTANIKTLEHMLARPLTVIAESDLNDPRLLHSPSKGGYGIDSQWCDDLHHSLHAYFTGENQGYYMDYGSVGAIAKALDQAYVFDGSFCRYRKAHHGASPVGLKGQNFIVYTQTHDQVGNRAKGERLCHLIDFKSLKLAAAMVLTSPFIPMIFQGEEWAASTPFQYFTDHQEPELAAAVSAGRVREFQSFGWEAKEIPDPQSEETFIHSQLIWQESLRDYHKTMLEWYQHLITFRKQHPELTEVSIGEADIDCDEEQRWITLDRGTLLFYYNLNHQNQLFSMPSTHYQLIFSSSDLVEHHAQRVLLPPESMAIFKKLDEMAS